MNRAAASDIARRLVRRVGWEAYSARVVVRRWAFDRVLTPARRRALLAESRLDTDADDEVFTLRPPVGLEPAFGYVVAGRFGLIEESLIDSKSVRDRDERQFFSGVPTPRELVMQRRRGRSVPEPLITIRHVYGFNYYHAVVDCIGTLALIDGLPELASAPIVVGADLYGTEVFRTVLDAGLVDPARIIVHDRWLDAGAGITFAQHDFLSARSLRRTASFLARAVPRQHGSADHKLYVARGAKGLGRGLRNEGELVAELDRRGFVVVDPGDLPWVEQFQTFRAASQVVGVHGAALTNILFRAPGHLSLYEMVAPDHNADAYQVMSAALGFEYRRGWGTQASMRGNRASFVVAIDEVLQAVDGWADP